MNERFDLVKFVDNDFELVVRADKENDTVWLNKEEIGKLFDRDRSVISRHLTNIFKDELDKESNVQKMHVANSDKPVEFYSLDTILYVGYRVKSKRGVLFRKWANKVLKEQLIKGYSINEKRITKLNKKIEIQNRIISSSLNIDQEALVNVIEAYTNALDILDNYDHQCLSKPNGRESIYVLTYTECRAIIDSMKFGNASCVFGVEKEIGKLEGILAAVYQNVYGQDVYPSLEEKAAHLLYFLVKDHPFVDGCKRIAATLFLEFLNKNRALVRNGKMIIANDTLVAITVLTAESKPDEMDVIVNLIMNFLV